MGARVVTHMRFSRTGGDGHQGVVGGGGTCTGGGERPLSTPLHSCVVLGRRPPSLPFWETGLESGPTSQAGLGGPRTGKGGPGPALHTLRPARTRASLQGQPLSSSGQCTHVSLTCLPPGHTYSLLGPSPGAGKRDAALRCSRAEAHRKQIATLGSDRCLPGASGVRARAWGHPGAYEAETR